LQVQVSGKSPKMRSPPTAARVSGRFQRALDSTGLSIIYISISDYKKGLREVEVMKKMIAILLIGMVAFGTVAFAGPGFWKIPEDAITADGGPGFWKIPEGA